MLFLIDQLGGEFKGGLYVFASDSVLVTNLLDSHASGKTADDPRHGYPGAPDNGLAVLDFRVDDDLLGHMRILDAGGQNCKAREWGAAQDWVR